MNDPSDTPPPAVWEPDVVLSEAEQDLQFAEELAAEADPAWYPVRQAEAAPSAPSRQRTEDPMRDTTYEHEAVEHYFPEPEELGIDAESFPAELGNCSCGMTYAE
jgi:hypothetical protein